MLVLEALKAADASGTELDTLLGALKDFDFHASSKADQSYQNFDFKEALGSGLQPPLTPRFLSYIETSQKHAKTQGVLPT